MNEETFYFCPFCGYSFSSSQDKTFWTLEQIYDTWQKRHFRKVGEDSIRGIKYAWSKLQPLHGKRLSDIDIDDFQAIIDTNGTSFSRQHQIRNLVSLLCDYGVKYRIIPFNFGQHLILDAPKGPPKNIFSDDEIVKISRYARFSLATYSSAARITLCMIYTGLRPNEFFALTKKSINLREQYIIGGGKTAAGTNRLIPIPNAIFDYIKEWYDQAGSENSFLLQTASGTEIDLNNWRKRQFYPLLSHLKINAPYRYGESPYYAKYVPYSCRHTFASLSARAKMDRDILSKLIGHTDPSFTQKVYVHQKMPEYKQEMQKLENLIESFSA